MIQDASNNTNRDDRPGPAETRRPVSRRRLVRKPTVPGSAPGSTPAQTFRAPAPRVRDAPETTAPPLRLVGDNAATDMRPPVQNPTPITDPADPRWVLALRTAERLQGSVLPPEDREKLTRLGKMMGLSPFDCALVLAIVQDQARRGIAPANCPAAGQQQLALIPLPVVRGVFDELRKSPLHIASLVAGMLALQGLLLWMWLG